MKKFLCLITTVIMSFLAVNCLVGCGKKELTLSNDMYTTFVGNGIPLSYFVDLEAEGISRENTANGYGITVEPDDSSIASMDYPWLMGKKIGSTKVKLSYNGREATITFNVIPMIDYLKKESESNGNKGSSYEKYLACRYFLDGVERFKNPASIEVLEVFKHTTEQGVVDYYMMECRGQNSFGGNTVDWVKVDIYGISDGFSPYIITYITLDGFDRIAVAEDITLAVKEYLAGECR